MNEFINSVNQIRENIKLGRYNNKTLNNIPSALRHEAWKRYISDLYLKGKCFCCRTSEIEVTNFDCGHIISRKNGGPVTLENLRSICGQCNKSMGTNDMDEFINSCGFWDGWIERSFS